MREESIFAEALLIAAAERAAFLERVCGDDAELRRHVEALLAAHAESNVLDRPAVEMGHTGPYAPPAGDSTRSQQPGTLVGAYKLREKIGEGGMGEVWVAEQSQPIRRRVALKLIKAGMDSKQVLARFEAERQALALMDHPHIARVLDAGSTPEGRPFFVMELVKGTPITDFCDARRLAPRERLTLFVTVCQAIQHAHTKGIIHRDIKPSNVLVELHDDKPVVKVIDFGVAKAVGQQLTERTIYTGFGTLIGTPAYMAPEQATFNALDVDTRADVYALGVLLYELLAGSPPFEPERLRQAALDEVLRLLREEEPPRPSDRFSTSQEKATIAAARQADPDGLARTVRGELDWIALKALEKDRARRYQSATGLAEDVERYLRDEQVEACPPSWGYRAGKFLRKHRAALTLAGTAAALLLVGAAVSGWFAWWAISERDLKNDALAQAQQDRDTAREERDKTKAALVAVTQKEKEAQTAHLTTRRAMYAQSMTTIAEAWEAKNRQKVAQLLDRLRPVPGDVDLRGFEWHWWDRQLHAELRCLSLGDVPSSAFHSRVDHQFSALSADGTRVAFALVDLRAASLGPSIWDSKQPGVGKASMKKAVVKVVDTATGKEVLSSSAGGVDIRYLSLNRDGTRLAFYDRDRGWVVWDVDRKQTLASFPDKIVAMRGGVSLLDPDGRHLLNVRTGSLWDVTAPERDPIRTTKPKLSNPLGRTLTKGKPTGARPNPELVPHCCFNSDGSRLAMVESGPGDSETVSIWDVATGKRRASVAVEGSISNLAFSPDGKRLYGTGRRQSVYAWDGAEGDALKVVTLRQEDDERAPGGLLAFRLTCSPDGKFLAVWRGAHVEQRVLESLGGLLGGFDVRILDANSGVEQRVLESLDRIRTAAFSKDGKRLITLGYSADVTTPDRLLCKEWDLEVAQPRLDRPEDKPRPAAAEVTVRSRDGERQASYTPGKPNVTVLNRQDKVIHVFEEHGKVELPRVGIGNVIFSPNERFVMSRDNYGHLAVWEPDTGKILRSSTEIVKARGHRPLTPWIFFDQPIVSPDGRVLFIHEGKEVKAVNFDDLTDRFSLGEVNGIWFSPDGKRLLAYRRSRKDEKEPVPGGIHLWDIESKTLISSQISNVAVEAFEPDGRDAMGHAECRYLLVQEGAGSTAIWDTRTLEKRLVLKGDPPAFRFLRFSPDGERLATLERSNPPVPVKNPISKEAFSARLQSVPGWLVWDVNARKVLFRLPGPSMVDNVQGDVCPWITFSPDSQRIATMARLTENRIQVANGKKNEGSMQIGTKVWDATTGQEVLDLKSVAIVAPLFQGNPHWAEFWLSFSPDGSRLSVNYRDQYHFGVPGIPFLTWDATPREEPKR